jgi:hypothetical protein
MNESSPFTQASEDEKGLLGGELWALILGSLLALLLLGCLILFAIFRKRGSTQTADLSHEGTELEFEEVATYMEQPFFISQYGLSESETPWDAINEGSLTGSDEELGLEDTGDGFASEYGFSDGFRNAPVDFSDEAESDPATGSDNSGLPIGDGDALRTEGPNLGPSCEPGAEFGMEGSDDDIGFSAPQEPSDDWTGFE